MIMMTPMMLSPAMRPEAMGMTTPSCWRRRKISAIAEPANIAMQLLPGIIIAMPRPFADGMYGLTAFDEYLSASVRTTPMTRPIAIAHFVEYFISSMPFEKALETPAHTMHDGAGQSSVPSTVL